MKPQLLIDSLSLKVTLEEAKGNGKIGFRGEFAKCDVATKNNRLYRRSLMERELKRKADAVSQRRFFGELDHPGDGKSYLQRAAFIVTSLKIDDAGVIFGEAEALDTSKGKDLKALIRDGCQLGISSRGVGSLKTTSEGVDEVQDDYKLLAFDAVVDPADNDAFPENYKESVDSGDAGPEKPEGEESKMQETQNIDNLAIEAAVRGAVSETLGQIFKENDMAGSIKTTEDDREVLDTDPNAETHEESTAPEESKDDETESSDEENPVEGSPNSASESSDQEESGDDVSEEDKDEDEKTEEDGSSDDQEEAVSDEEGASEAATEADKPFPGAAPPFKKKGEKDKKDEKGEKGEKGEAVDTPEDKDTKIAALESELEELRSASKRLAFEYFLEKRLKEDHAKDTVLTILGDPSRFGTIEDLSTQVEKIQEVLAGFEKVVRDEVAESLDGSPKFKAIYEEVEGKLEKGREIEEGLRGDISGLTEERDILKEENRNLSLQLYIAEKIEHNPKGRQIKKVLDEAKVTTEEEVNAIISSLTNESSAGADIDAVRARVRANLGGGVDIDPSPVVENAGETSENYNDLGVSFDELASRAGISK